MPLHVLGFYLPTILKTSLIEQEDLVNNVRSITQGQRIWLHWWLLRKHSTNRGSTLFSRALSLSSLDRKVFNWHPKLLQLPSDSYLSLWIYGYRSNSLNSIPYKNDETILGLKYGLKLILPDLFSVPPRIWFNSVAIHVLCIYSDHLIFDSKGF